MHLQRDKFSTFLPFNPLNNPRLTYTAHNSRTWSLEFPSVSLIRVIHCSPFRVTHFHASATLMHSLLSISIHLLFISIFHFIRPFPSTIGLGHLVPLSISLFASTFTFQPFVCRPVVSYPSLSPAACFSALPISKSPLPIFHYLPPSPNSFILK